MRMKSGIHYEGEWNGGFIRSESQILDPLGVHSTDLDPLGGQSRDLDPLGDHSKDLDPWRV